MGFKKTHRYSKLVAENDSIPLGDLMSIFSTHIGYIQAIASVKNSLPSSSQVPYDKKTLFIMSVIGAEAIIEEVVNRIHFYYAGKDDHSLHNKIDFLRKNNCIPIKEDMCNDLKLFRGIRNVFAHKIDYAKEFDRFFASNGVGKINSFFLDLESITTNILFEVCGTINNSEKLLVSECDEQILVDNRRGIGF